jgi:hypothetical protein
MLNTTITPSSLDPCTFHVALPSDPQDLQDPLDAALMQAKQKIEEGNRELINLERKFLVSLGRRLGDLEQEQASLQKELILKQHNITVLPKLNQELWTAHLEATRVSMGSLATLIADFVKSFKDFQTSFPAEAISQTQSNAVPNLEWLTAMQAFVNKHPAQCPLSRHLKTETTQASLVPKLGGMEQLQLTCFGYIENPSLFPYLKELHDLEDQVAKTKKDLAVLEKEEQDLKRNQVQVIESWNKDFVPYLDTARALQETFAAFLKQQGIFLKKLSQESATLHARCLHVTIYGQRLTDSEKARFASIPGEITATIKKSDQASLLHEQIQLIVPLIEKMLFKTPIAKAESKEYNS